MLTILPKQKCEGFPLLHVFTRKQNHKTDRAVETRDKAVAVEVAAERSC